MKKIQEVDLEWGGGRLKKFLTVMLFFFFLFFGYIGLRFGSALTQEGDPFPYLLAISKYEFSNKGYEEVLERTNDIRYVSEFEEKYPFGVMKEIMETKGWQYREQMGSGLVFEKERETITIETRQFSKHYYIWDIPKEIVHSDGQY